MDVGKTNLTGAEAGVVYVAVQRAERVPTRSVVKDLALGKTTEDHRAISGLIDAADVPEEVVPLQNGAIFDELVWVNLHRERQVNQAIVGASGERRFFQVIFAQVFDDINGCGQECQFKVLFRCTADADLNRALLGNIGRAGNFQNRSA